MNHEFYGPAWADHHAELGNAVARLLGVVAAAFGGAFERLHAYQYDAPWRNPAETGRPNGSDRRLVGWYW
jgi:hypothetical protein